MKTTKTYALLLAIICLGSFIIVTYQKAISHNRVVRFLPMQQWGFGQTREQIDTEKCVVRGEPDSKLRMEIRRSHLGPETKCGFFSTWTYTVSVAWQPLK